MRGCATDWWCIVLMHRLDDQIYDQHATVHIRSRAEVFIKSICIVLQTRWTKYNDKEWLRRRKILYIFSVLEINKVYINVWKHEFQLHWRLFDYIDDWFKHSKISKFKYKTGPRVRRGIRVPCMLAATVAKAQTYNNRQKISISFRYRNFWHW